MKINFSATQMNTGGCCFNPINLSHAQCHKTSIFKKSESSLKRLTSKNRHIGFVHGFFPILLRCKQKDSIRLEGREAPERTHVI